MLDDEAVVVDEELEVEVARVLEEVVVGSKIESRTPSRKP